MVFLYVYLASCSQRKFDCMRFSYNNASNSFSLFTSLPSLPVMSSELTIDPFVVGMLLTVQMSFIATGNPIRGPRSTPDFNNVSIAIALSIAFFHQ